MKRVNTKTGFSEMYDAIRKQEIENECPLLVNGCFLNTSGSLIDAESIYGGSMIIANDNGLLEFWKMARKAKREYRKGKTI